MKWAWIIVYPGILLSFIGLNNIFPSRAEAGKLKYRIKFQLGSEYDTNTNRQEGGEGQKDGLTRFHVNSRILYFPDRRTSFNAAYQLGGRVHFKQAPEDVLVNVGSLMVRHRFARRANFGFEVFIKDRTERIGDTDYLTANGGAFMEFGLARSVWMRLRIGYGGFNYKPDGRFDYMEDRYSMDFLFYPLRRLRLTAGYSLSRRHFDSGILMNPVNSNWSPYGGESRNDHLHTAHISARYMRGILIQGGYDFTACFSNSYGTSYTSHRFHLLLSMRAFWRMFIHLYATFRILQYADTIYIQDPTQFLEDENRSSISLKLSRAITGKLSLEASYSYYANLGISNNLSYARHIIFMGLAFRI